MRGTAPELDGDEEGVEPEDSRAERKRSERAAQRDSNTSPRNQLPFGYQMRNGAMD